MASNNEAEYDVVIYALRVAMDVGVMIIYLFTDSKLMPSQFGGLYQANND